MPREMTVKEQHRLFRLSDKAAEAGDWVQYYAVALAIYTSGGSDELLEQCIQQLQAAIADRKRGTQ